MNDLEEYAGQDVAAKGAGRRGPGRAERFDILVASILLLLLIFGWVKDLAKAERWPGSDLLTTSGLNHAWSGGALR